MKHASSCSISSRFSFPFFQLTIGLIIVQVTGTINSKPPPAINKRSTVLVTSVHHQRLDIESLKSFFFLSCRVLKSIKCARYQPRRDGDGLMEISIKKMLSSHGNTRRRLPRPIQWKFFVQKKRQIEMNNIRIPFIPKRVLEAAHFVCL